MNKQGEKFRKDLKFDEKLTTEYQDFYGEGFESINELDRNNGIKYYGRNEYKRETGKTRVRRGKIETNVRKNRDEIRESRANDRRRRITKAQAKQEKRKYNKPRTIGGVAVALSVLSMMLGYILPNYSSVNASDINGTKLSQALQDGKDLGIDQDLANRLQTLINTANRTDLAKEEIIQLVQDTYELNYDLAKTKIANVSGVGKENVSLDVNEYRGEKTVSASVKKNGQTIKYVNENYADELFGYGKNRARLPKSAENLIEGIYENRFTMMDIQNGDIDSAQEDCKEFLSDAEDFAVTTITVSENGNMTEEKDEQTTKSNEATTDTKQITPNDEER